VPLGLRLEELLYKLSPGDMGRTHPKGTQILDREDGNPQVKDLLFGADDGIRTRDPHLGKVVLYQLSHVRV
jgi:hypothetical protein